MAALAKDPAQRWQSAEDFAAALEAAREQLRRAATAATQDTAVFAPVPVAARRHAPPDGRRRGEERKPRRWPLVRARPADAAARRRCSRSSRSAALLADRAGRGAARGRQAAAGGARARSSGAASRSARARVQSAAAARPGRSTRTRTAATRPTRARRSRSRSRPGRARCACRRSRTCREKQARADAQPGRPEGEHRPAGLGHGREGGRDPHRARARARTSSGARACGCSSAAGRSRSRCPTWWACRASPPSSSCATPASSPAVREEESDEPRGRGDQPGPGGRHERRRGRRVTITVSTGDEQVTCRT